MTDWKSNKTEKKIKKDKYINTYWIDLDKENKDEVLKMISEKLGITKEGVENAGIN